MTQLKKNQEMKVYGRHAVMALFKQRPQDVIRLYVTEANLSEFKPLIAHCVKERLAYHVVEETELEKLSRATHHEGVLLIAKSKKAISLKQLFHTRERTLILALEQVENPHNLGAILRSAAHFGVQAMLYQAKVPVALAPAALRTAEGGAEAVTAVHVSDWSEALDLAKKQGFEIFATTGHGGDSLFETSFPAKTLIFFGAEGEGLSQKLLKTLKQHLMIPGTGAVESLNVSNAVTVILSEWYRQGQR
jgi:TrmH RNA methyltransferase